MGIQHMAEHGIQEQVSASQPTVTRVLVVDDNADASQTLAALLRHVGYQVSLAATGPRAIEVAEEFQPDVVLLDIGLPGMDGFQTARNFRARRDGKRMVLVAISGYGVDEHRRQARDAGFDQYFTKPVGFDTLREFLARLRQ
jgi:CheY-like chemotaxis protein